MVVDEKCVTACPFRACDAVRRGVLKMTAGVIEATASERTPMQWHDELDRHFSQNRRIRQDFEVDGRRGLYASCRVRSRLAAGSSSS